MPHACAWTQGFQVLSNIRTPELRGEEGEEEEEEEDEEEDDEVVVVVAVVVEGVVDSITLAHT